MNKLKIDALEMKGQRVLTRVDYNVPLSDSLEVTDDLRIRRSLPTVAFILVQGGTPLLMSHLGRPKGKVVDSMRMNPVAQKLEALTGVPVVKFDAAIGSEVRSGLPSGGEKKIALLENLRFNPGETENDPEFAEGLADLGDLYVNDAFGTAHRAHASVVGVPKLFPGKAAAGFLMAKELTYFQQVLDQPARPMMAILGGAKVSDKLPVVKNLMGLVEKVLIGGIILGLDMEDIDIRTGIHESIRVP